MMTPQDAICVVCGGETFDHVPVVWPELAGAWELGPEERAYIDVQQGTHCRQCGTNVRSQALARALLRAVGAQEPFEALTSRAVAGAFRVLEVNEAGTLTPWLSRMPGHTLVRFPEVHLERLPFADAAFDLVVHSDTLEHVPQPGRALAECRRVVSAAGACVFTVPVVVGRLTRSRQGLPPSYHGDPSVRSTDYLVQSEFGSDVWVPVLEAGFASCEMVPFRFPAGLAVIGRRR